MKFIVTLRHCALILYLSSSALCGCAWPGPIIGADRLHIERISSDRVNIGAVYARKIGNSIGIFGEVTFKESLFGFPSDHIVVKIIDPGGKVLYTARTHYYRNGKPTKERDNFNFSLTIPLTAPNGSVMRLESDPSL
jgi:hypothetical protein